MRRISLSLVGLSALFAAAGAAAEPAAFWISVVDDGVYRVAHEDLAAAAALGSVASSRLALQNEGSPVPIWIEDGGDGSFDPGDSFEFVARHLAGTVSFYSEYSRLNPYRLTLDGKGAARTAAGEATAGDGLERAPLRAHRHLENDAVMVRFGRRLEDPEQETWFWQRLSFLEEEPFRVALDLEGLAAGEVALTVDMRGWSRHKSDSGEAFKHHRVELSVDGRPAGVGEWDGQETFVLTSPPLDAALLDPLGTTVEIAVPTRHLAGETDPVVDLSLLNWIEVDYPHDGTVTRSQTRLAVAGSGARVAEIRAPAARSLVAFDEAGHRWLATSDAAADLTLRLPAAAPDAPILAVRDGGFRAAAAIAVDEVSSWRRPEHRVDYLMIAHRSLLAGTERLADFHRQRGLEVAVIDVQDLYDEFNHGILHPRAIRDFIAYAHAQWQPPAPKFVLLVGDASWDVDRQDMADENYADWSYQSREGTREGFLKNQSTPYAEGPDNRGLIPTGSFKSAEGHAASDNYFVAIGDEEGLEYLPVLAIGRLPIALPAELDAIVDKTIRYVEESGVGPWRRHLLWISNEQEYIQERTDILADEQVALGFGAYRVYPQKSETSNEQHQQRLLDAFAEGQLLVHFHGHGGRYIWRTGPTDYKKNRDLFNLDHLDQLSPSARLPIILSMTCFSAPFDHPLADSIGEKFLRLPDRGAIAVFAASWRNSPATDLSRALVEELTRPQTIGEAVLAAKRRAPRRDLIESYNLLGDPAVPVAAPQERLEVTVSPQAGDGLLLRALLPAAELPFTGRAIVEWRSAAGDTLASQEVAVSGEAVEAVLADPPAEVEAVSVYAWDESRGRDALGVLDWAEPAAPDPPPDAVPSTPAAAAPVLP
ncbi:MAG: C25 family cysteine peptidase [Acidobacteriota bacterium]|nr:C25 family cysteine peptidase [Acidobacteriota bacterium]MDH3522119.1 C25 family cysteine peptidase [Acidobacteriota bacterium]